MSFKSGGDTGSINLSRGKSDLGETIVSRVRSRVSCESMRIKGGCQFSKVLMQGSNGKISGLRRADMEKSGMIHEGQQPSISALKKDEPSTVSECSVDTHESLPVKNNKILAECLGIMQAFNQAVEKDAMQQLEGGT